MIGYSRQEKESIKGLHNKSEFEKLLYDIEKKGDDPMIFIRDKVLGNHRWHIKQKYFRTNKDKFERNPYWFLSSTHLYIGLRLDQAR